MSIESIKSRLAAATPGPWLAQYYESLKIWSVDHSRNPELPPGVNTWTYDLLEMLKEQDAEFIAHSRTDIEVLVAAVESVIKELGNNPTNFEKSKDHYYLNPNVKISTTLATLNKILGEK